MRVRAAFRRARLRRFTDAEIEAEFWRRQKGPGRLIELEVPPLVVFTRDSINTYGFEHLAQKRFSSEGWPTNNPKETP